MPDFYIVSSFFYKKSKEARVPNFVSLFCDDANSAKRPGCDEGTNLRLRDFAVVPLMPTRDVVGTQKNRLNETVLLSTQNICYKLWVRKYLQFYAEFFFSSKPVRHAMSGTFGRTSGTILYFHQ